MTALDPWAGIAPDPRPLTRQDRVLAAAQAVHIAACIAGTEVIAWRDLDQRTRDLYEGDAYAAVEAAYPTATSELALEALPVGTLIVSEAGAVYRKALQGGLSSASGMTVGTLQVWEQPGERETGRKPRRLTSAQIASGRREWTVVWTVAA